MNLYLLSPEIAVAAFGLLILLLDLVTPKQTKAALAVLGFIGVVVAAALSASLIGVNETAFSGALVVDAFAIYFKLLILFALGLVLLTSVEYVGRWGLAQGEYYALVLFAAVGMMLLASTRELITIYLSLELTTLALVALVALARSQPASSEAGLKYLLLSVLASATLLYGIAILYGLTGTTVLADIAAKLTGGAFGSAALIALALVVAGFGFKIAAVPFHMWVPDVYQGAPTPVTAFLSVGSKAAGFAVVVRVFTVAFAPSEQVWPLVFAVLSALTMTLGNVVALRQSNIKRMLAYSSIGQAGYAMMGLAASSAFATSSLLLFLLSYAITNLGAFAAVIAFSNEIGSDEIADYNGLSRRSPLLALVLTLCLVSLAGIPPMVGFVGKLYLFTAVFNQGLVWLVVLAVLNSAISVFYYIRPVRNAYFGEPSDDRPMSPALPTKLGLAMAFVCVLAVGLYPAPALSAAQAAAVALLP